MVEKMVGFNFEDFIDDFSEEMTEEKFNEWKRVYYLDETEAIYHDK